MNIFKLNLFQGHPIIEERGNIILIDTGAPTTIHNAVSLHFCSENYNCSTEYLSLTTHKISEMLGTEITTLLGADILSKYNILLDYEKGTAEFSKHDIKFQGKEIHISSFMGIPVIELTVNNHVLRFFLDTGAKLSYIHNKYISKQSFVGIEDDFYPGVGAFQTDVYEIMTRFDNHNFLVKYGNLPNLLQMTLMLGGIDGIIGCNFFENFKVLLDLQNNKLKFEYLTNNPASK